MQQFVQETGLVVPLDRSNIDTDQIIPKQYLKSIQRTGFGINLFDDWRYLDPGEPGMDHSTRRINPDFVLNDARYAGATILLARDNFGCGSSREHAPWAILEYGLKAVIAPSFADIFFNNCFKNGILPIKVTAEQRDALMADAADAENPELSVDLVTQTISRPNGATINFDVEPFRKQCLLDGLDDIGLTLEKGREIDNFEAGRDADRPWL